MKRAEELFEKYNLIFLIPVIGAYLFTRSYYAGEISYFIHKDELEQSYEALCAACFGTDSTGSFPSLFFNGPGDGHSAFFIYLGALGLKLRSGLFSLKLFRLIPAMGGLLGLIFSYLFMWQLTGKKKDAFISSLLVLTLPLYFISQRCFAEDFLVLSMIPAAFFFLMKGIRASGIRYFLLSGLLFSLILFTSPAVLPMIPVFLVMTISYLFFTKKGTTGKTQPVNSRKKGIFKAAALCLPGFIGAALLFFGFGAGRDYGFENLVTNVIGIKGILWDDGHDFHVIKDFGSIYIFSIPFFLTGAFISLKKVLSSLKTRRFEPLTLIWILMLTSLLFSLLKKEPDISSSCLLFFSVTLLISWGIAYICKNIRGILPAVAAVYIISFCVLCRYYFVNYNSQLNHSKDHEQGIITDVSLGQSLKAALKQYPDRKIAVFSSDFEGRNLMIALYTNASPADYGSFSDSDSFSFGKISVNPPRENGVIDDTVYVIEQAGFPELIEGFRSLGWKETDLTEYTIFFEN